MTTRRKMTLERLIEKANDALSGVVGEDTERPDEIERLREGLERARIDAALAAREGPPAHEDMEKRMHEVWSNGAPVPWLRFAAIWRAAIDFAEDRHVERMAPVVAALADAKGAPTPAETEAHHVQTEWEPTDVEIKAAARGWAKRADGSDGNFHPEYVKRAMHQCARAALKAAHKANPDE